MGIPTFAFTRQGFGRVVKGAFAGIGFPADASLYEFPMEMFLMGSDLTPIKENVEKIVHGLTRWTPEKTEQALHTPEKIEVNGKDYHDTIIKMNLAFLRNGWADGLPVLPATEERVNALLEGTDLHPNEVVGVIPPSGRIATVESLAISLAMTGGRPEYMPVLLAAIKAFTAPLMRAGRTQTTTCAVYPVVIVNGPVGKQIRLNAGYSCLGPDPAHPAGASIGRAIRLIQQNIGGAIPGSGTMSVYGGPARYTDVVFAEDEEGLPSDWAPLSRERGFPDGSNIVTLHAVATAVNVNGIEASTREVALQSLKKFVRIMVADFANVFANYSPDSAPGVILMPRGIARGLSSLGWSKDKVKAFLWENSKIPWPMIKEDSMAYSQRENLKSLVTEGEAWPLAASAKNLIIAVAGGEQSGHGYLMRVGPGPLSPVSAEIALPGNWEQLLRKAEEELGPLPAR